MASAVVSVRISPGQPKRETFERKETPNDEKAEPAGKNSRGSMKVLLLRSITASSIVALVAPFSPLQIPQTRYSVVHRPVRSSRTVRPFRASGRGLAYPGPLFLSKDNSKNGKDSVPTMPYAPDMVGSDDRQEHETQKLVTTQRDASEQHHQQRLEEAEAIAVSAGDVDGRDASDVWRARALLVGAAALYGTNFSLVKILGDSMPVGISTTLRFALATLATLPWLFPSNGEDLATEDMLSAAWLGFEVGLWNSVGYIAQAVGLATTDASKSAFICSLAVVTVPMLEFFTGKTLKNREWVGAILAVVGVGMLELGGVDLHSGQQSILTQGDLLSFVQPLAFGLGFWRIERAMARFPTQANRVTAAQLLAVFLSSAAYALWSTDVSTLQSYPWHDWLTSPSVLFSVFWTGCVTTAFTIYMETQALRTLTAAETTLIFSTEPLFGTAFAATVMGEQLGAGAAFGSALILLGCVYSNLGMDGVRGLWRSSGVADRVAGTRFGAYVSGMPARMRNQWLWFGCSAAASLISFTTMIEEEVPVLAGFFSDLDYSLNTILSTVRI